MNKKKKYLLMYTLVMVIANMLLSGDIRKYFNIIGLLGYLVIGVAYFALLIRKI